MPDESVVVRKDDLFEAFRFENRITAAETVLEFQKGELEVVRAALKDVQNTLNETVTKIEVQQSEFKNLVESIKESSKRNARDIGITVSVVVAVIQVVLALFHL